MSAREGTNLRRLMAHLGLTNEQVAERSGLDLRTVRGILDGTTRPQLRTLTRLAEGLEVSPDEFFVDPAQLLYRRFDRDTNPVVEGVVDSRPDLFAEWTVADFDELHSRFGTGGPLTFEGAVTVVEQMNQRRELHEKFAVLLESSHGPLIRQVVEAFYQQAVDRGNVESSQRSVRRGSPDPAENADRSL